VTKTIFLAITALSLLASSALAHELDTNRATLVLRDRQHLSITFFVDYTDVLHQVLAPQKSVHEFVLMASAMKPQEFQVQLQTVQRKLQNGTVLTLHKGKSAQLVQWVWPGAASVQSQLQQRAMQVLVAPGTHAHLVRTEIRAEAQSGNSSDFSSVTLRLPSEFKDVLVVSYQPKQVWVKPQTALPTISF
jgi:hypothetical protein